MTMPATFFAEETNLLATLVPVIVAGLALIGVIAQAWLTTRGAKKAGTKMDSISKAVGANTNDADLADVVIQIRADMASLSEAMQTLTNWQDTWLDADGILLDGRATQREHNKLDKVVCALDEAVADLKRHNITQSRNLTSAIDAMTMKVEMIQTALRNHVDWEEGQKYLEDEMVSRLMEDIRQLNIKLQGLD